MWLYSLWVGHKFLFQFQGLTGSHILMVPPQGEPSEDLWRRLKRGDKEKLPSRR